MPEASGNENIFGKRFPVEYFSSIFFAYAQTKKGPSFIRFLMGLLHANAPLFRKYLSIRLNNKNVAINNNKYSTFIL